VDVHDLLKSLSGYDKFAAGGAASLLACMAATDAGDDVGAQAEADPLQHILQRVHNSKGDVNIIASAMSKAKTAGICEETLSQIRQVSQAAIMSAFVKEKPLKEALKVLHQRMQAAKNFKSMEVKLMEVALQKADKSDIPPHHPAMKKYMKRWRQLRQKQEGVSPTSDTNPTVDDIEQVARVSGDTEADDEATVAPRRLLLRQHGASLGDSSSWSSPPMVLAVTIALTVLFVGVVWFFRNRSAHDSSASGELCKPPASAKRKGKARSRQSQRQQQTKKQQKRR
jgi:cobalamin biosynthesis Mg chelatase CobN